MYVMCYEMLPVRQSQETRDSPVNERAVFCVRVSATGLARRFFVDMNVRINIHVIPSVRARYNNERDE